ncbi:MAG TPA: serine/threonine-protein kinase, partial [Thermoanaerobaculia bacterium]|nr:serine/threonine-protein kinase [Thermoanaerobaculia bacterium]
MREPDAVTNRRTETETIAPEEEPPPLPAPLAVGELFAGRFLVRRELGRGGFAVVYEALDEARGEPVALKLLRTDRLGRATRTRFEREAAIATELAHRHLVAIREAGSEGTVAWIAMELVDGESLGERARRGPLPVDEVLRIARDALAGLAALHASGLVHRDVKPSNLLLDADGTVKLADFGLARRFTAEEAQATSTAALVGTLDYLSPEQALGDELDGRSDLYSLGVVLFELLAGRPLHEGRSTLGTLLARLKDPVPDLSELRPEVPAWLAAWMDKLLARERDDRYASAEEALADLEQERGPLRPRGRRLRRRRGLAAAALLLLALATAAVGLARRPRFDRIVAEGPTSVRALDRRGHTLWQREGPLASRNFLPVRTAPRGPFRIAAVLADAGDHSPPASRTLSLLDPLTGAVRETEVFPSAETLGFAPELADSFGASLWARDLDGDGADEL